MKPHCTRLLLIALIILFSVSLSFSQSFVGSSSTPVDNNAQQGNFAVAVAPPGSMQAGDLVIIYAQYRANSTTLTISATGGQTWNSATNYTLGGTNQSIFITWCRFSGTWGANPSIAAAGGNAMTVSMYVYRPSNASHSWGVNVNATNSTQNATTITVPSVNTTMTNTVTMAFWSNASTNTWTNLTGAGWSKAGLPAQTRNTQGAGQTHTAAYNIQTTTRGATGTVSQDQPFSANTIRNIISWHELKNDNCSGALSITSGNSCTNVPGSLSNATNSGVTASSCSPNNDDDVWFSFVATDATQLVQVSGINISIQTGGGLVAEVFSGACGSLTSLSCRAITGASGSLPVTNLTKGATYYIRVYSVSATQIVNAAGFNMCVLTPAFFGKSFRNVTKGATGGTVETNDILEVRASIVIRNGVSLDSCAFFDNIPAGTTYVPGSLAILTNEGKVYKSFTDAAGDDEGWISGSAITINMGYNQTDNPSTAFRRGRMASNHRPVVGGGCLMMASYQVQVTQTTGNNINVGGGSFTYSFITNPTNVFTRVFNANTIKVYTNYGLCSNAVGVNVLDNTIAGDFDGTFGSGNTITRALASPNVSSSYTLSPTAAGTGDFFYSLPNNTCRAPLTNYTTSNAWPRYDATYRVFGVLDIVGDHTNATDQLAGNPAADTTGGATGGYMLFVNSSYNLDTVFKYPISGLCPNTYYELSFWIRNMCPRCGIDSTGLGAANAVVDPAYIPTAPGDSSGVRPNLSFSVDDVNHYTSGEILYSGQWIKKGFVFLTGPAQTFITMAIANNAPGGGGNDWALDDIRVSTCLPGLTMRPNNNPSYCLNASVDLSVAVSTFYNNYSYYQWERSTDGGATWGPAPEMPGVQTFSYTYSNPNYLDTVAIPTFVATAAMNGYKYRIRSATTLSNLSIDNCSIYNSTDIITINVNPTCDVLPAELVSFTAQLKSTGTALKWEVKEEADIQTYEVERSNDGRNFSKIGAVAANGSRNYSFNDAAAVTAKAYYRLLLVKTSGARFSNTVTVMQGRTNAFEIVTVNNPFGKTINAQVHSAAQREITLSLVDMYGRVLTNSKQRIGAGFSTVKLDAPQHLQSGNYILRITAEGSSENRMLVKQ
jgi:hypothetical protein